MFPKKLFCVVPCVRVACIDHMECMRFCDSVHGKCTDATFIGNNGLVHKADTDSAGNQGLDGDKAADGYFSVKVTQFISGCIQTLFKDAARTGALFSDNNCLAQRVN